jgi:hypothetical protein
VTYTDTLFLGPGPRSRTYATSRGSAPEGGRSDDDTLSFVSESFGLVFFCSSFSEFSPVRATSLATSCEFSRVCASSCELARPWDSSSRFTDTMLKDFRHEAKILPIFTKSMLNWDTFRNHWLRKIPYLNIVVCSRLFAVVRVRTGPGGVKNAVFGCLRCSRTDRKRSRTPPRT